MDDLKNIEIIKISKVIVILLLISIGTLVCINC